MKSFSAEIVVLYFHYQKLLTVLLKCNLFIFFLCNLRNLNMRFSSTICALLISTTKSITNAKFIRMQLQINFIMVLILLK